MKSLFNEEEFALVREARLKMAAALRSAKTRGYNLNGPDFPSGVAALQVQAVISIVEGLEYLLRKEPSDAPQEPESEGSKHSDSSSGPRIEESK